MKTIESIPGLAEIIASRPELQHFSDDEWALAQALAGVFQQTNPSAEQCTSFIDDAEQCAEDVGPGPYKVAKLGVASGNFSAVVMVNNWLCAAEEGEGFILLTPMSDLTGISIAQYAPCQTAKAWGECVLADGHETREQSEVGAVPMENHIDRWGRIWGVAQRGN